MLFLLWRGGLLLLTLVGLDLTYQRASNTRPEPFGEHYVFNAYYRWDSLWYERIAERGYELEPGQNSTVFFPLYPYLCRWVGPVVGGHQAAGLLISHLATLGGLFFFFLTAMQLYDEGLARRAAVLLLSYPGSYFLSAYYTEGLFLFTTAACFYFFFRGRFIWCGVFGLLAGLTRSAGALLFASLCGGLLLERLRGRWSFRWRSLGLLLIPCSYPIFAFILYRQVGNPWAFVEGQAAWNREPKLPTTTLLDELARIDYSFPRSPGNMQIALEAGSALGFLAIGLSMVRSAPTASWLYVLGGVLLPLSTGKVQSMVRFTGVLFPAFWGLGQLARRPLVERALIYAFSFLLSLLQLRFGNWWFTG